MNGSLYANVNGNGLFRMSGTAGKARLDEMKFLGGPESSSEHGNHALIPVRGREELYVMNGNHTPLPSKYTSKVVNWAEDILLTDRKSTRLNSSHVAISYAVFCLKIQKEHDRVDRVGHVLFTRPI